MPRMISEADTMELLETHVADAVQECGVDVEEYEYALNRVRYRFAQCVPVAPKFHKGKYGKQYDSYSCGNCGYTVGVPDKYCPNCGYMIDWRRCYEQVAKDLEVWI